MLYYNSMSYEEMWMDCADKLTNMIQNIIEFAKLIPGFMKLSQDDQILLLKSGKQLLWFINWYFVTYINVFFLLVISWLWSGLFIFSPNSNIFLKCKKSIILSFFSYESIKDTLFSSEDFYKSHVFLIIVLLFYDFTSPSKRKAGVISVVLR